MTQKLYLLRDTVAVAIKLVNSAMLQQARQEMHDVKGGKVRMFTYRHERVGDYYIIHPNGDREIAHAEDFEHRYALPEEVFSPEHAEVFRRLVDLEPRRRPAPAPTPRDTTAPGRLAGMDTLRMPHYEMTVAPRICGDCGHVSTHHYSGGCQTEDCDCDATNGQVLMSAGSHWACPQCFHAFKHHSNLPANGERRCNEAGCECTWRRDEIAAVAMIGHEPK